MELYLDGECANVTEDVAFNQPADALYFGNPMLALADLCANDRLLGSENVAETGRSGAVPEFELGGGCRLTADDGSSLRRSIHQLFVNGKRDISYLTQ